MKIAIVIERIESWRGGAEKSTAELSSLLAQRGHQVHVVTSTLAQSPPDMVIHRVSAVAPIPPLRTLAFARNATRFLQGNVFDLVMAISPVSGADVYQPRGGLLAETWQRNMATRPGVAQRAVRQAMLALNVKRRCLLRLEREACRDGGPVILAVSQYVARQCEMFYGLSAPRVRVVFNGVQPGPMTEEDRVIARDTLRQQHHIAEGTLLLLFIAHNFRLKGLRPLTETVAGLVRSNFTDFHLLVVGRDNPAPYQRWLDARGLARYVTFVGPTQRVGSFYQAADVCVHPTYYDPCSRVVLEALWHGVPCITTSFNGAAEVMEDGVNGFVIGRPDDIDQLVRRIKELQSAELRRSISRQAVLLRDRISMTRHVEALDAVFAEVVRGKQARKLPA